MGVNVALYIASVLGAVSLFLMVPRTGFNPRKIGALLGAATLGGLWLALAQRPEVAKLLDARMAYYYIFSALAIASAVRVITHAKPVYSALWFVMLILNSAGLLLLLNAEFMAFALVIIYGGAILVTYVFVIMLAAHAVQSPKSNVQSPMSNALGDSSGNPGDEAPTYDRVAREPVAAVAIGFLLLAMLLTVAFKPHMNNPDAAGLPDRVLLKGDADHPKVLSQRPMDELARQNSQAATIVPTDRVSNTERVGLDLFQSHPLGLELAGVILLVSLVGAVVIARIRVEDLSTAPVESEAPTANSPIKS